MRCASRNAAATLALLAAMTALPATAVADGNAAVSIELRPRVQVAQGQVRLGDIAYLTARDLPMLRQLMALPVGAAPWPGSPALLERDTLERWVAARSGLYTGDGTGPAIRWSGAGETAIEAAAQELPGDTVVDAARSALMHWLSQRSLRAEVQAVSTARDLTLPAGNAVLRVRPLSAAATPSRRMLVWVDAWVDDRFVRTTAISFDVAAWAPATVAAARLDSGTAVDAVTLRGATTSREVNLAELRQGVPLATSSTSDATGQRLRRALKPGEVLTDAHLEPMPAVTRGNWAQLLAHSGNVTVESRVEVLQDGRRGQLVRVKVPGAGGEVVARVTGPGQVEVQP